MLNLREIHKPATIADALELLRQPNTVALAGGTQLLANKKKDVQAVVDLSALGLSYILPSPSRRGAGGEVAVAIGATTTLADVADSPMLRAAANGIVAEAAHRTAASILRNQASVSGTLIAEPAGIFAVALTVLDAQLMTSPPAPPLLMGDADFLARLHELLRQGALVTEIVIPAASLGKRAALQTVARTPRDKPIVCVGASARIENGIAREVRIALGGAAESAMRVNKTERELENKRLGDSVIEQAAGLASQGLSPRGDYRGSDEYRKEMAVVLTRRALKAISE